MAFEQISTGLLSKQPEEDNLNAFRLGASPKERADFYLEGENQVWTSTNKLVAGAAPMAVGLATMFMGKNPVQKGIGAALFVAGTAANSVSAGGMFDGDAKMQAAKLGPDGQSHDNFGKTLHNIFPENPSEHFTNGFFGAIGGGALMGLGRKMPVIRTLGMVATVVGVADMAYGYGRTAKRHLEARDEVFDLTKTFQT
jgi:hypothetical protein